MNCYWGRLYRETKDWWESALTLETEQLTAKLSGRENYDQDFH